MTHNISIRLLLSFCLSLVLGLGLQLRAQALANEAFERGDYAEALRIYQGQLEQTPQPDANLYYNLAVCYAQMEQPTDAIVNYERALYLDPTHQEARHNLSLLYARVKSPISLERGAMQSLADSLCYVLPLTRWIAIGIGLFVLALALLFCFFLSTEIRTRRWLFYGALTIFACVLLANAAIAHQWYYHRATEQKAIVRQPQSLHSSPSKSSQTELELYEGTPVEVLSTLGSWTEVRLPNDQKGWLPNETIQHIIINKASE